MTKLPYVAGYNIKLAFIIQDLKNLDEIYGETSRHSLLGNCGYQLVLGANDQATAEYASRALGKRTIRYQSESRTIELMGLPRRTKVEQIRERDLMMPQEVRQMPENKMILLIEGQRPIFGEKLRFFQTQPFKSAEAFSQANIPRVPEVDYLSPKPVPATTPEYAKGGEPSVEIPSPAIEKEEKPVAAAAIQSAAVKEEPAADDMPSTPAKRTVNRKALRPSAKATAANTGGAEASPSLDAMEARIRAIEEGLKPKAAQLREVVEMKAEKLGDKSPTKRRNIMDIFSATVPDPVEVGVAAE